MKQKTNLHPLLQQIFKYLCVTKSKIVKLTQTMYSQPTILLKKTESTDLDSDLGDLNLVTALEEHVDFGLSLLRHIGCNDTPHYSLGTCAPNT